MSYKVLIVDDDSIVRIGLKSVVDWQKLDLEIIGEASDGVEAYELISRLRPDIVLTDMHMPRSDGVRLMEQAKRDFPDTLFLVLSCDNDLEYVTEYCKTRSARLKPRAAGSWLRSSHLRSICPLACCAGVFWPTCSRARCRIRT